jgi:hypothetical protein
MDKDFRRHQAEWVDGPEGQRMLVQVCEELVDGRWEPSLSVVRVEPKR